MVEIIMDEREFRNTQYMYAFMSRGYRVKWIQQTLDYSVPELGIGIERKTAGDFMTSLNEGKIFSQADDLARLCDDPWIVLDDDPKEIPFHRLFSAEHALNQWHGCQFAVTFCNLPEWLHWLIHRKTNEEKPVDRVRGGGLGRRAVTTQDYINHILLTLPGIGWKRVEKVQGMKIIPAIRELSSSVRGEVAEWIE